MSALSQQYDAAQYHLSQINSSIATTKANVAADQSAGLQGQVHPLQGGGGELHLGRHSSGAEPDLQRERADARRDRHTTTRWPRATSPSPSPTSTLPRNRSTHRSASSRTSSRRPRRRSPPSRTPWPRTRRPLRRRRVRCPRNRVRSPQLVQEQQQQEAAAAAKAAQATPAGRRRAGRRSRDGGTCPRSGRCDVCSLEPGRASSLLPRWRRRPPGRREPDRRPLRVGRRVTQGLGQPRLRLLRSDRVVVGPGRRRPPPLFGCPDGATRRRCRSATCSRATSSSTAPAGRSTWPCTSAAAA